MDGSRRRAGVKTGVVAGSVWESRMRSDEVRGGIKVFNGDEKTEASTENNAGNNASRAKRNGPGGGKRKTWKPESSDGSVPQVSGARAKAELSKNADEMAKELSVSADGPIKKSPAGAKRGKRDAVSGADQAIPRSPVPVRRSKSEAARGSAEKSSGELRKVKSDSGKILDQSRRDRNDGKSEENAVRLSTANSEPRCVLDGSCQDEEEDDKEAEGKEAIDGPADGYEEEPDGKSEENAVRLSTANSEPRCVLDGSCQEEEEEEDEKEAGENEAIDGPAYEYEEEPDGKSEENAVRLSTANLEPRFVLDGSCQEEEEDEKEAEENEAIDGPADGYEEEPDGESKSDEIRKEVISSEVSQVKSAPKEAPREDDNISNDNATNNLVEEEEGQFSEELEEEQGDGEFDEDAETEPENKSLEIKEIVVTEKKTSDVVVKKETKPIQVAEKPKSISPTVKKQPLPPPWKQARSPRNNANLTPSKTFTSSTLSSNVDRQPSSVTRRSSLYQNLATKTNSFSDKYQSFPEKIFPERQNKLQSLVDLVMWRDVSKSAFIFGLGTFVVISSSYTKDISFSFITVVSYLGLFYLAAIFLYRSIVRRGYVDIDDTSCVLGEEEAMWLLKLVLPYLNEFLLKLKALFSGDPSTTMKLAVLLFVFARCGSSITIWKMAKFGFFGVFTVPKVCSSYSGQITAYGKFWIRRFRDAWNSCSHKKAVAAGIFTLVWNLCSVVARIWAVFMLYVAFRYYQQNLLREDWAEDNECVDDKCHGQVGGPKNSRGPRIVGSSKGKKAS